MSTRVTEEHRLALHQLVGPGAGEALAGMGLPQPAGELEALPNGTGFVARTGAREYLVAHGVGWAPDNTMPPWCFERCDRLLRLQGKSWCEVMSELCTHDMRRMRPGDWFMGSAGGVDVWIYAQGDDEDGGVLIGCDPSLGNYLRRVLDAVIADRYQRFN